MHQLQPQPEVTTSLQLNSPTRSSLIDSLDRVQLAPWIHLQTEAQQVD